MTRLVMKRYIAGDEKNRAQEERGVALLTTVVCSALFMLLGLSLAFSSLTEFKMSTENTQPANRPCSLLMRALI